MSDSDEALVERLRSFSQAYPEDIFLPLTEAQTKEHALVITRASAAMGRHLSPFMAKAADRIEALEARAAAAERDALTKVREIFTRRLNLTYDQRAYSWHEIQDALDEVDRLRERRQT